MHTLTAIFSVLFGLAFGSFLNVCISRLPRGESVVSPGSRCPHCGTPIRAFDNIPLLSWTVLLGRCRTCRKPIHLRYPAIEAVTAALFLLCFLTFGLSVHAVAAAVLCFLLVGLTVMDAETFLLPDAFTIPGIALGFFFAGWIGPWSGLASLPGGFSAHLLPASYLRMRSGHPHLHSLTVSVLTALAASAVVLVIRWLYWLVRRQEGMGLGDAKLMAMIGAWFGPPETFLVFFIAVVSGALYGLTLIALNRIAHTTHSAHASKPQQVRTPAPTRVPLGAFLCLGAIYAIFWGGRTLNWYMGLFT